MSRRRASSDLLRRWRKLPDISRFVSRRWRATEALALLSSLIQACPHALTHNLAFELRENGEHPRHRAARRRRQIERLG
jgi:hypothetical protein